MKKDGQKDFILLMGIRISHDNVKFYVSEGQTINKRNLRQRENENNPNN